MFLRMFGEGQLTEPRDVALGRDGRVYVADTGNDRVAVFSTTGAFLDAIGEGEVNEPSGAAVEDSTVYVADTGNDRVALFTTAGAPLSPIPAISSPRDAILGADGLLYVASFGSERVDVFAEGVSGPVRSIGVSGQGELSGPAALAADGVGGIYVADQAAQRVIHFTDDGDFLDSVEAAPNVAGVGVACQGNVFATEAATSLARVVRFGEQGTPPPPCATPPGEPVQVTLVPLASNRIRFAGLAKNRRNGSAVLFVRVPGPGRVILKGRGVRRLARGAQRPKVVRLPVKPKVRLRHFLKRHGKGRIRVEVTFRPVGGESRSIEKVIVLRRKRR